MAIRIGNNRANTIFGTNRNDIIFGLAGDDIIDAGAGNDWVFAGAGNDQIFAGDGNDWVFAGTGNDSAFGGAGNDFLYGEAGNDVLDGGLGSDIVDGGTGNDTLIFTDAERGGLDRYIGGTGQDSLVLEFASARWANPAVQAEVRAYLAFLAAGGTGNFTFTTMNLIVSSVEALVVKVDGVIIDPRAGGNTVPTGVADSYSTGENGLLNVSPATERGTVVDNDNTGTGAFTVELVSGPARGAVVLNANGAFVFDPGTAFDFLTAGQSVVETFTYRIVNSAGVSAPITVSLNIAGANDAATIGGTRSGSVTEDSAATATGAVTITDADTGQAALANPGTLQGTYGALTLAANGTWTYTLNNSLAATQALGTGDLGTETFAIGSVDGTAASAITVTVNGVNDAAVISGSLTGTVIEDNFTLETESVLATVSGQVTVTDADSGESAIGNAGTYAGAYGSLVLSADGSWAYTLNNDLPGVQALGGGDSVVETFNVTSLDGSATAPIVITVLGSNDEAQVSGSSTGLVVEDGFSPELEVSSATASGQIIVEDVDTGESGIADPGLYLGIYGSLDLAEDGGWTYTLNSDLTNVQALRGGVQVHDVFELATLDGTLTSVDITVLGVNDDAIIDGVLSDTIILQFEDSSAEGFVTVSDVDTGEAGVAETTVDGNYGTLFLQDDGSWTYYLTDFNLPFDEAITQVNESFSLQTLGGDTFSIDVTIQQDGFFPS
jgi:VCBS repeat-containing protein